MPEVLRGVWLRAFGAAGVAMPFVNYTSLTLRASAITSGANERDDAVTLPETITSMWALVDKTAEDGADNLLTVRLQAQVDSAWVDVPMHSVTTTGAVATAADTAANVTRAPNIIEQDSNATFTVLAHYTELPSNIVRVASITEGTTPTHTFSVVAYFTNYSL